MNGVDSSLDNIYIGIPQGFCLGPLLFLIYINDLPQAVQYSNVHMYADDTSICHQSHNLAQLNEAVNSDPKQLDTWLKGNKRSLNFVKTSSMLISTKQRYKILKDRNEGLQLNINGDELALVQSTRYLGVYIDSCLDCKEHIRSVSNMVSRALGILKYTKSFLPLESLKTLYLSAFEPHFR